MRTLSTTLASAQQAAARQPYVRVTAANLSGNAVHLKWERLYNGNEADSKIALALPSDNSLIRLQIAPGSDNNKLYRQRVVNPGTGSDFSQWTYLYQYGVAAAAACSREAEVSLFWAKSNGEIDRSRSLNNGETWQSTDFPGYAPSGAVTAMAAAYKPNGDLALFFTESSTLYLIKQIGGVWQSRVAWNQSTGLLSGVAAAYNGDWKLLVSGRDTSGNYKIWSLVYGDGAEASGGIWTPLQTLASAPADGLYEYGGLFLDILPGLGGYRCSFVEKFGGSQVYNRVYQSHSLPGAAFLENRWVEPVPFNLETLNGAAAAHCGNYAWLACAFGVWRASLSINELDLSADVVLAEEELEPCSGKIAVELNNNQGWYDFPGEGDLSSLYPGCEISFSSGYVTKAGIEYSAGKTFVLGAYEHNRENGRSVLTLQGVDGWSVLAYWSARSQMRWNKDSQEASVQDILGTVLARAGLDLEVVSSSSAVGAVFPDFTIHTGNNGKEIVRRLLSFVPDVLFIEGGTGYLVHPLSTDNPQYTLGDVHTITTCSFRREAWGYNHVQAEGRDPTTGQAVTAESFAWDEITSSGERFVRVEDRNLESAAAAQSRGEYLLRKAEIAGVCGQLKIPVNCGQQLYDVVQVTSRVGIADFKRRVQGLTTLYCPSRNQYEMKLILGRV